jgi:secretion/DNA translocation related CpaE-like protein
MQARNGPVAGDDPGGRGRPLVVTGDGELLDELVGLAAAGGVEVSVAIDAIAAEDRWASAPLVVVGADQATALVRRNVPRRLGVVLVSRSGPDGTAPEPAGAAEGATEAAEWLGVAALHPEHVVRLPEARSWLVTRFAECRPSMRRRAAPVVAFVSGHPDAGASLLAVGVALAARQRGLATLLVSPERRVAGTARSDGSVDPVRADPRGTDATPAAGDREQPDSSAPTLAVLSFDRSAGAAVLPDAMAAALRAARHGRDLVVVDLPHAYDDAYRLALSAADRCYLTVVAGIRECAAGTRVAAAVRRHCPRLALVVRIAPRGGLRPDEVAEALGLPLAGVLPPVGAGPPVAPPGDPGPVVAALCRRLLAQIGATSRPGSDRPRTPVADVSEEMDA